MSKVDKRPCTYCMYNKPEHNVMVNEMDKIASKKDNPKPISNKKMFESKEPKSKEPKSKKQEPLDLDLKEGAFTADAKRWGYGDDVQRFAKDIMKQWKKNKMLKGKKISPTLMKRANFVIASEKWKK